MTKRQIVTMLAIGIGCGVLGLVLGYTLPLMILEDATAGPLWGIFVTGPLAFVVGIIASATWISRKSSHNVKK